MLSFLSKQIRFVAFVSRRANISTLVFTALLTEGLLGGLLIIPIFLLFERPGHNPLTDHYQTQMLEHWGHWLMFVRAVVTGPALETFLLQVCLIEPAKIDFSLYKRLFRNPGCCVFLIAFCGAAISTLVLDNIRPWVFLYIGRFLAIELPLLGILELARRRTSSVSTKRKIQRTKLSLAFVISVLAFSLGHLKPGVENVAIFVSSGIIGGLTFAFVYSVQRSPVRSVLSVWLIHFLGNFIVNAKSLFPGEKVHIAVNLVLLSIVLVTYALYRSQRHQQPEKGDEAASRA